MKAKKILFLIAGIINSVLGGLGVFIGGLGLLLSGAFESMLEQSYELVESYLEALASSEEEFACLAELSKAEAIEYVSKIVTIVCLVLLLLGLLYVTFGVLNLLLCKRDNNILTRKKYLGVLLVVFSWLLMWFNVANILTTVAVCLRPKNDPKTPTKLYSVTNE